MRNGMRNLLILLAAVCVLFLCTSGLAASMHEEVGSETFDMDVKVGYGGIMTYGKTMPVRVRIRNFGDDFEGVLGVNAYVSQKEYDRYEKEIFVPGGSEREFQLPVAVYARQNTFSAEIVKDGEVVCRTNGTPGMTVNPSALLIGVLSTRPQNLNNLNISRDNDVLGRYEIWQAIPLTPDTFPEDAAMLRSFGMLVIDDVDPASLTRKQQELLETWIRSGRILICGGGANAGRNAAFFSGYTGLKPEEVTTSDSVLESLEGLLGRAESGKKPNVTVAKYSGGDTICMDKSGTGLIYRTTAGAGRIYTTAFETGDPRLNSESLMGYFWQQLLVDSDQELYSALINNSTDSYSPATVSGGYSAMVEARSFLPAGVLIVAGALAAGCVFWAVLKKKDKRQWMWLVLPVTAVLAAAGILLLSAGADTTRPLAVIADNLVQDGTGLIRNYSGIAVAAPDFGRHTYSLGDENLRVLVYDYMDYDEEENEDKKKEPDFLRTCYTAGGENYVTEESLTPWDLVNLASERTARIQGRTDGAIWMEEDGLHGEIMNGTDVRFGAGHIITTYGYVSIPSLAPGEKAEFVLTRKEMKKSDSPVYEDGGLYPDKPDFYSATSAAMKNSDHDTAVPDREIQDRELAQNMISGAADMLRRGQGNWSYGAYESALFLYCAKPENPDASILKVDGVPVATQTGITMMTVELPFTAVGRTGIVFRSAGMDVPNRVETDENRMPTSRWVPNAKQLYYHTLNETPTFMFNLTGIAGVKVEKLKVLMEENYYAGQCRVYALDAEENQWKAINLNEEIPDPNRFLNKDGMLYLQFRNNTSDIYADIPTPMITLEGRMEYAEN